jgi:hypothetical protein
MTDAEPYPRDRLWAPPRFLREGEAITGTVRQLPKPGRFLGNCVIVETDDGKRVSLAATPRKGHAVLARELTRLGVRVGDAITIAFHGWRLTDDGERRYRYETVRFRHEKPEIIR